MSIRRHASSPPLSGPYGPDAKPGLTKLPSTGQRHWTSGGRTRDSLVNRSTYGPMGNDLLTDQDGFVPEPGDQWWEFSWPEHLYQKMWEMDQRGDPKLAAAWDQFVAEAAQQLDVVRSAYDADGSLGDEMVLARVRLDTREYLDFSERLEAVDYGLAAIDDAELQEDLLRELEAVERDMREAGLHTVEVLGAIRYFLTDPERSRSYLYGPTDIGDGRGIIEKLKGGAAGDEIVTPLHL